MATVLVTGGAGYIGSHACKLLAEAGHTPVTYDNLSRGHRPAVQFGPLVVGDLSDAAQLDAAFTVYRPEAVMHFAAYAYVGESVQDPNLYYANNVSGTLSLLDGMRRHGVKQMVFSSTCATYGTPQQLPIDEKHPQNPINPYGASKLMVERILADAAPAYGLRYVALRYFNAVGADPDGRIGENHDPETHAMPLAILAALGEVPAFQMLGTDYPTRDGTAIRDYIHVMDLADAHLKALDHLMAGGGSDVFNLGTGTGTTLRELIQSVERVSGRAVPVKECPRRPGDPAVLVASADKARQVLGWNPAYRDLDAIVATALRWYARAQVQAA